MQECKIGIGQQIRGLRQFQGMTQRELGQEIGVSHAMISYIESGQAVPTDAQLSRIKAALQWPEQAEEAFAILEGAK